MQQLEDIKEKQIVSQTEENADSKDHPETQQKIVIDDIIHETVDNMDNIRNEYIEKNGNDWTYTRMDVYTVINDWTYKRIRRIHRH